VTHGGLLPKQQPLLRFLAPLTLEATGSDQHRACLTRLCSAYRLSQPLDALLLPKPVRLCFAPVTPLGFLPSEVFPPTWPTEPSGLPSLLDVAVGRLVWNTKPYRLDVCPTIPAPEAPGVVPSPCRSLPLGPHRDPKAPTRSSRRPPTIARLRHGSVSGSRFSTGLPLLTDLPIRDPLPRSRPGAVARHDRSRHSCKHERFPNGPFHRFDPPVHTPHGKPCVALPFGSHRLPCPFRRNRLVRRSSNPESTRRRPSIRFGTGLPSEDDLLAPPRLSCRQVGGLAPRKRDVRPSVSVGPGRPLMASTCCRVDDHRIAGLPPAFGRRDLNPEDSYARDMFGSVRFAGLASQPGSARVPALTPSVFVSRTCERCRSSIHAAMSTSNG
jgi:hypothetical protein